MYPIPGRRSSLGWCWNLRLISRRFAPDIRLGGEAHPSKRSRGARSPPDLVRQSGSFLSAMIAQPCPTSRLPATSPRGRVHRWHPDSAERKMQCTEESLKRPGGGGRRDGPTMQRPRLHVQRTQLQVTRSWPIRCFAAVGALRAARGEGYWGSSAALLTELQCTLCVFVSGCAMRGPNRRGPKQGA